MEALHCFHAQDYVGHKTLVIFNSLTNQTLIYDHPEVIVVNATERPASMGATRNRAIEHAPEGSLLVVWDDDDRYCSNHLSNFARGFDPDKHGWTRHSRQFHMESGFIKAIVGGSANTFAYAKHAWRHVGGYLEHENCGEDQTLVGKLTAAFPGNTVELRDEDISFCYGWAQGVVYHLSGMGVDKPGYPNGMERCAQHVRDRQSAMHEPIGDVVLKPKVSRDYDHMANRFTGGVKKLVSNRRGKVGILQLGHAGDIFNCLPIAKHIYDATGDKPLWFVNRAFSPVLEGVSYVDAVPLDIPELDILDAIAFAEHRCEWVVVPQVYGNNYPATHDTRCFNTEEWRMCGMLQHFDDKQNFPLVIDRRDAGREFKLIDKWLIQPLIEKAKQAIPKGMEFFYQPSFPQYRKRVDGEEMKLDGTDPHDTEIVKYDHSDNYKKFREFAMKTAMLKKHPAILVNVTGGETAPWKDGAALLDVLRVTWGVDFTVVDMAAIRAERIYDMLGLMDNAVLLVSNDTYALHLAAASKVPVVAILNDGLYCWDHKWLKTKTRCNTVLELEYSDALARVSEINKVISAL